MTNITHVLGKQVIGWNGSIATLIARGKHPNVYRVCINQPKGHHKVGDILVWADSMFRSF